MDFEKIIEQTEQMVNEVNNEDLLDEELDVYKGITDDEIDSSLNVLDNTKTTKKMRIKDGSKKTVAQIADDVVNAYIANKTDKNWEALQEFFWYGVKKWALNYVKNNDDADDMTIETFITAHTKFDTFNPEKGRFSTWIFTCCRNICLGFLKQKKRIDCVNNDISDIYESELLSSSFVTTDAIDYTIDDKNNLKLRDAEEVIKDLYNISLDEMNRLGGLTTQIMNMKYNDHLKIREIAKRLDMNESTVKNYLYKGRENLVRIIQINHKDVYDSYVDINLREAL